MIARTPMRSGDTPASRAIISPEPTSRMRKPASVRASRKAIRIAAMGTSTMSQCRSVFFSSSGQRALLGNAGVSGSGEVWSCSGPRTHHAKSWAAMRLSSSVDRISLTPRLAHSQAAIPA